MESIVLGITGMTCNSCVQSIEGHVGSQDGIRAIRVSLLDKKGYVLFDPTVFSREQVREMVDDMGFDAVILDEQLPADAIPLRASTSPARRSSSPAQDTRQDATTVLLDDDHAALKVESYSLRVTGAVFLSFLLSSFWVLSS